MMSSSNMAGAWSCPGCRRSNAELGFCPACGEQRPAPHQLTIGGLLEQLVESFTHADGRALGSMRALLFAPGRLTRAWMLGERRRWMGPFQLFLFINVIFFVAQSVSGLRVLSMPLDTHLHHTWYAPLSQRMVTAHLAQHGGTLEQLTAAFEQHEVTNAKLFVLAMVPMLALVLRVVLPLRRRLGAVHVVFALHFYAYLMASLTLLFSLVALLLRALILLGAPPGRAYLDPVISLLELALILAYLWPALARVYALPPARRAVTVTLLAATVLPILIAYRLLLFWLTLRGL